MFTQPQASRRPVGLTTLAAAAAFVLAAFIAPLPAAAAPLPAQDPDTPTVMQTTAAIDGLTEAAAAASCWEIKQNTPEAPSGVYWLATPAMGGAQQFYCDQERSGGGWVLIGRGREGWSVSNNGSGTPAQVRSAVTGPAAFAPRQLSSETIGQLVNGTPIQDLADGVRLVRAKNQEGTSWQDATFTFASPRADWTWQFNNMQRVGSYTFDSTTGSGGQTSDFGRNSSYDRVRTVTGSYEGWLMGFGFGSQIRGNPAATSYLWAKDTSTGYARPFTQVFLRPKLLSQDLYTAIPDEGTAAVAGAAVAESFAQTQPWSVAGIGAGPQSIEGNNEVAAFTEDAGKVYVGGNFTTVKKTANGEAIEQGYLAAFDRATGEWVSTFRPTFNSSIRALATLPGNRIAAGGFFSEVNGEPRYGLVVLDGTTGAIDTQFTGRLINYLSGGFPLVRALDVQDGWLYAAGSFTHATGGTTTQERYMRAAARFDVTDGTPAADWNPELNGTVMSIDASDRGDRVYLAGYFSQSRGRDADKGAAVSVEGNELFPWTVEFSNRSGGRTGYQQAVKEVGDRVWLGGSEHSLFSYSRDDFSLQSTTIGHNGGDFQAIATYNGVVYGGCHCFETQYEGATLWPNIGNTWTAADAIWGTGAWNAATGERITEFNGAFSTYRGAGSWALFVDSGGVLWQGGDYSYSTRAGYVRQWSSGFTRHVQRDATPPTVPAALAAVADVTGVTLTWDASNDDRGVTSYEVLRDDRVVATVTTTTATLPPAGAESRYFVRAVDAQGNKSASTAVVVPAELPETPTTETYISAGDSWSFLFDTAGPSGAWKSASYDATAWATGAAPFGWGHTGIATALSAPAPVPLVSFYRKTFEVADASLVESVEITTRADDGVVVYVNGIEVGRQNMGAGAAGVNTYATSSPNAATALANPVTITVPGEHFVTGTNAISVSMHSGYRSTPSHSFDLQATATLSEEPVRAESVTYLPFSSNWSYLYDAAGPGNEWQYRDFDSTAWNTGQAPLGWGHAGLGTTLSAPAPVPLASFYRTAFEVTDASKVESIELTTRADDGIVVYVNGTEVGRHNMPTGAAGITTYATASPNAAAVLANPVYITVPGELLVSGTNIVAVSVHSGYRSTPSHSFSLRAVGTLHQTPQRATQVQPPELTPVEPPAPEPPATEEPEPDDPEPDATGTEAPDPETPEPGAPDPEAPDLADPERV